MKRLDTEIKTNGHYYKLLRRSEEVALYRQYHPETGQLVGYELFRIKTRPLEIISGKEYPSREVYASQSDWGVSAWTLSGNMTEAEALNRFEKYVLELKRSRELKKMQSLRRDTTVTNTKHKHYGESQHTQ